MSGALFRIFILTEHHEIHFSQNITCDCSIKTKYPDYKKPPNDRFLITMVKDSRYQIL